MDQALGGCSEESSKPKVEIKTSVCPEPQSGSVTCLSESEEEEEEEVEVPGWENRERKIIERRLTKQPAESDELIKLLDNSKVNSPRKVTSSNDTEEGKRKRGHHKDETRKGNPMFMEKDGSLVEYIEIESEDRSALRREEREEEVVEITKKNEKEEEKEKEKEKGDNNEDVDKEEKNQDQTIWFTTKRKSKLERELSAQEYKDIFHGKPLTSPVSPLPKRQQESRIEEKKPMEHLNAQTERTEGEEEEEEAEEEEEEEERKTENTEAEEEEEADRVSTNTKRIGEKEKRLEKEKGPLSVRDPKHCDEKANNQTTKTATQRQAKELVSSRTEFKQPNVTNSTCKDVKNKQEANKTTEEPSSTRGLFTSSSSSCTHSLPSIFYFFVFSLLLQALVIPEEARREV